MCEWEYKYCEHQGLEFYVCGYKGQLYFDVDYGDEFIVTDFGDDLGVLL